MCVEIKPEFFLASMLYDRTSVTRGEVKEYTKKIYSSIKAPRMFVDTCTTSLYLALECSSKIYLRDDIIYKSDNPGRHFDKEFILKVLGHSLDEELRNEVFELLIT